jgi:septum formation protein
VLGSVGAYRLEGRGVQLFSRIEGDHFAILGLPLLELLQFLRERGLVGE